MANYSFWIHGTAGLFSATGQVTAGYFGSGAEFRSPGPANASIFFPIPSPIIIAGARARLVRVFTLYTISPNATFQTLKCMDGSVEVGAHSFDPTATGATFYPQVAGPAAYTGETRFNDAEVLNATRFDLKTPANLVFGLALVASVQFNGNSSIAFTSVGADFET